MAEHTPTPWGADQDYREGYEWNIHIVSISSAHPRICFMSSGPEAVSNSDLIIRAVNAHADLVNALRLAESLAEHEVDVRGEADEMYQIKASEVLTKIRDALTQAGSTDGTFYDPARHHLREGGGR